MIKKFSIILFFTSLHTGILYAETWNCGPATGGVYSDSVKCTYDEATKTLTIYGEGPMGDYATRSILYTDDSSQTPWVDKDIVHAVIEGNVTTIGERVFKSLRNLEDVTGLDNIVSIGAGAFKFTNVKYLDLSNVQEIGHHAFQYCDELEYIEMPDEVRLDNTAFLDSPLPSCGKADGACINCKNKYIQQGVGCVSSCPEGYTSYYGFCTRTRYTLPEADEATSDDNENMIEWIFE